MKIHVLGLGNPEDYILTRHNVGKEVLRSLVKQCKGKWNTDGVFEEASISIEQVEVHFVIADGFMNTSGKTFKPFLKDTFIVVHDDVDIALGVVKNAFSRGDGGHNGIKSINNSLEGKDYHRIRIGIGPREEMGKELDDFVMGNLSKKEQKVIQGITLTVKDRLVDIVKEMKSKSETKQQVQE